MAPALKFFVQTDGDARSHAAVASILPAGVKRLFRRRLIELSGAFVFAAGALLAVAVLSYAPGDPSLNSVGAGTTRNLLGWPGALAADIMLQGFGLAGLLPSVAFGVWGWRLIRNRGITHPWVRLTLLLAAMVFAAIGLSAIQVVENWPLMSSMGGIVGMLMFDWAGDWSAMLTSDLDTRWLGAGAAIVAVGALFAAFGLTWRDWCGTGVAFVTSAAGVLFHGIKRTSKVFGVAPTWASAGPVEDVGEANSQPLQGFDVQVAVGGGVSKARTSSKRDGLVVPKKSRPKVGRKARATRQGTLEFTPSNEYRPPALELLEAPPDKANQAAFNKNALQQNATFLGTVLEDFGVKGNIVKVRPGPVVTLYELEPAPGTKTSRVISLSDDIARSMSAVSVRVAVVPGRNLIGIELPNVTREMVCLRELLGSAEFENVAGKLPLALGKDISGTPVTVDLARMPHLLIAGTTGSGKSVAMNTMILSLLYHCSLDQCRFIMIDPKMLELSAYEGIPHLMTPVVTEPSKAVVALKWTVREMEDRYRVMSQLGVRNIAGYNARLTEARKKDETLTRHVQTGFDDSGKPVIEEQPLSMTPLPFIVVVVDEMADLMLIAGKDVEAAIQRLAQMARAAGIHLIMATQRPSVDVITGTIKANFPTRVSFQVTSKIDSRTILGEQGAEQLLGQGDMLYMAGGGRITRVHGPFVSDDEVEEVVSYLKTQGDPVYVDEVIEEEQVAEGCVGGGDALYDDAVALVAREGKASTSFIQRHLKIGYNRAARIIEQMESQGIISPANRVGRREVLIGNY